MDSCKIESLRPGIYLLCKGHHHLFMFRIVLASIFAAAAFVFFRRRRRRRHGLDQKSLGVLIFGGTSGIGKAMCDEFLAHGDRVVVASRRTGCNVTDEKSVEDCILNAKNELGRIDLVINMAAMGQRQHVLVKDSSVTELESVVKTNVLGTLIVSKISARLLEPGSRIVLVGGAGTSSKRPTIGHATYAFSKAGLSQFVASLAAENPSLGVHLLVPGIAITPLLAVKERSELSRWYFNVLGEMPETMAKYLVPRVRGLELKSTTISYLTMWSVLFRFATCFLRKNRLIDEKTGDVIERSSPLGILEKFSNWLVQ